MVHLLHYVRRTKEAAALISMDLKNAYSRVSSGKLFQFLKSKDPPPAWISELSHLMVNRHLRVISQNSFSLAGDYSWINV